MRFQEAQRIQQFNAYYFFSKVPGYPLPDLLSRLYPYYLLLNKEGKQAVEDIYSVSHIAWVEGIFCLLRC